MTSLSGEERAELARKIRTSTMFNDPDRLSFSTKGFFSRRAWHGLLRAGDAVFLATPGSPDDALVIVAKSDIEIAARPPEFRGSSLDATFRIGGRRYKGRISPDALERFHRWQQA